MSTGSGWRGDSASPFVLAGKLRAPVTGHGIVRRPRPLALLHAAPLPKLTLVSAPPGWGKTTLLAAWSAADRRRFGWISLDGADNDVARFAAYLVAALRVVSPGVGEHALALSHVPGTSLVDDVLPPLLNELAEERQPAVLVLDDYHLITDAAIHAGLAFMLERLPETLRLVMATRSDPPLPLARMRARGELLELRADELRFGEQEAAALLNDVLGLALGPQEITRLRQRTEGWAVGLHLAALLLRGHPDPRRFVASFAGEDRHIIDYLGAEVLDGQPEPVRGFLLRTSILERMSGPLCDAVTGQTDSAALLEQIERSNLFLVPLDTKRVWYRYHLLFREVLRHKLQRSEPELVAELHQRASGWHQRQGLVPEAIRHATAAGDARTAADLIAQHWLSFFNKGQLATVTAWLDGLPGAAVEADPRLCLARAWIAMDTGRAGSVDAWLKAADRGIRTGRPGDDTASPSGVVMLRALNRFKAGAVRAAREAAERVLDADPAMSTFWRTVAQLVTGVTRYWSGATGEATAALRTAERLARADGNSLGTMYALGYLATIAAEAGELHEAEARVRTGWRAAQDPTRSEHFVAMALQLAHGRIRERRGQLDEADAATRRAVVLARRGASTIELADALLASARIRAALGDWDGRRELLAEARRAVERCPDPGILANRLAAAERHRQPGARARPASPVLGDEPLSDRELDVLRLLPSGLSQREIAEALYVSQNTVKTHTRGIYRKLGASSRAEAVARARTLRLV